MRAIPLLPLALVPLAAGTLLHLTGVNADDVAHLLRTLGFAAPVLFLALASLRPLVGFPGMAFTLAAGVAWGPLWGALLACLAATAGGVVAFLIGRHLAAHRAHAALAERPRLRALVERAGFRTLLAARLAPFLPDDALHFAAAVSPMSLPAFALATFLGTLPGTALLAAGAGAVVGSHG